MPTIQSNYTNVFTGLPVQPSQVSYRFITLSTTTPLALVWPSSYNDSENTCPGILDVNALALGSILLPDARQVSVGQTVIIANVGTASFSVSNANGGTLTTIPVDAGSNVYYFYLTNNDTLGGAWRVFGYGAGTTSAQASLLAGQGLIALPGGDPVLTQLNTNMPALSFTDATSLETALQATDTTRAHLCVWGGGTAQVLLPYADAVSNGYTVSFRNSSYDERGKITFAAQPGDQVDGLATTSLEPGQSFSLVSDGQTHWWSLGYGKTLQLSLQSKDVDLTGIQSPYDINLIPDAEDLILNFKGTLTGAFVVNFTGRKGIYYVNNLTTSSDATPKKLTFNFLVSTQANTFILPPQPTPEKTTTSLVLFTDGDEKVYPVGTYVPNLTVGDGLGDSTNQFTKINTSLNVAGSTTMASLTVNGDISISSSSDLTATNLIVTNAAGIKNLATTGYAYVGDGTDEIEIIGSSLFLKSGAGPGVIIDPALKTNYGGTGLDMSGRTSGSIPYVPYGDRTSLTTVGIGAENQVLSVAKVSNNLVPSWVNRTSLFPAGIILPYGGTVAPPGFELCDGGTSDRQINGANTPLFNAIGVTFGSGNLRDTFNRPDMRGVTAFGYVVKGVESPTNNKLTGDTFPDLALGKFGGGFETTTLAVENLPPHVHEYQFSGTNIELHGDGTGGVQNAFGRNSTATTGNGPGTATPFKNVPPGILLNYIISTGL